MTLHTESPGIPPAPEPIGISVPRRDGRAKVTGRARYTTDLRVAGMCHARILRSPHPHARIRSIDATEARRAPGVVAVVTADDLSDLNLLFGHVVRDQPILASGVVRHAGEPVVGVVGETALAAEEALELIEVDYEPLPFVTDAQAALEPDAPRVHASAGERGSYYGEAEAMEDAPPNLATRVAHSYGDLESAFSGAALVLDNVYDYPMVYAYAMEPYTAIAEWDERGLTVTSSTQSPFMVQAQLAHCFKLPLSAVRVSIPYVGGAFGSKGYAKIEPLTAALALRAGRPVRLALSVEESILTGRSVPARIHLATAFDGDGRIRGRRAKLWLNSGAYTDNTGRVAGRAARRLGGAYRIPAMEVDALAVYTNTAPAASYRGLGARQAVFAGESQLDEAAAALGIDPLELRRRNLLRRGERAWPGARGMDADLPDDLRIVEEAIEWERQPAQGRAQAVAIAASDAGAEPTTSCILRVLADGSVVVMSGSSEFGQGSSTVLAQIAAAELGVTVDAVRFINSDTASVSFDRSTGASRTTTMQGLAIQRAAMDAREQLIGWARQLYAGDGPEPIEERGGVRVGDQTHSWSQIINDWFGPGSGEAIGRGYARRDGVTAELPLFWEVALTGIDAEVDRETGEIKVHRLVSLSDVGRAVNPRLLEGQDIGGAMMGLGIAQREELIYEEGMLQNGNLFDYRVPRTADLPEIRSIVAERADGVGAYGIKGGGEGSVNPVAPALATAVERATGVRLRQAPLTPERVWRALREAAAADAAAARPDREGDA